MKSQIKIVNNKKGNKKMNAAIKIKLIPRKDKIIEENKIDNTLALDENMENTITEIKLIKKEKETKNINSIQIKPSKDFVSKPEEISTIKSNALPSTCVSKVSTLEELILNSTTFYPKAINNCINPNISLIPSSNNIKIFPEVKYSPVPERESYDDILEELLLEENNLKEYKECVYINYQQCLDIKKRACLISFIYKMAKYFTFKNRTIFLCVQTMDRFFCKEKIDQYYFVLLCICCLVISFKFNEIHYPSYKDIIPIFANGYNYTVKQALQMETLILRTIDYNLLPIFPMCFFDILAQKANLTNTEYYLGNLMLDLIQFDFHLYPIKNSVLAQTVFGKVLNLTRGRNYDSIEVLKAIFPAENFEENSETIHIMKKTSVIINDLLQNLNSGYFVDIYEKYIRPEILGESINYFLNE